MSKRLCTSLLSAPRWSTQSQCLSQRVAFSTARGNLSRPPPNPRAHPPRTSIPAPTWRRGVANQRMAGRGRQQAQQSVVLQQKKQMKEMQESGRMLDHVGILPGTFVPPTGKKLPSIFEDYKGRLKLEYYRLFNWLRFGQSRFVAFWFCKPRFKTERFRTPTIAKKLYEQMYMAFADGNLGPVQEKLSPGLISSLTGRINQRPHGILMRWRLHEYVDRPRCVSYLFATPDIKGPNTQRIGVAQAVIRIRSVQSLLHVKKMKVKDPVTKTFTVARIPVDRDGNEIPADWVGAEERRTRKETTEYLVLQKNLVKGREGAWQVWGTTQETTLDDIRKEERKKNKQLFGMDA